MRLIDGVLSREAYADLLGGADVVLLPYSRRVYYARTSGPFTEALAGGKPVIVALACRPAWVRRHSPSALVVELLGRV